MPEFTFLELHLHDSDVQFGPSSLDSLPMLDDLAETDDESAEAADESESSSGGRSKILPLLVLAGLGMALRKLAGDDDERTVLDNVTDLGVVTGGTEGDENREMTGDEEDEPVSIEVEDGGDDESGGSRLRPLVGLVLVVGLAVVARKLLGGSEDLDELEALDDVRPEP